MAQDKLSTLFSTLNSQGIYNDMSVDEFRAKMADSEKRATVYNGMRKWNIPGVADTFEAFSADLGFAGADTGTGIAEQNARQLDALIEQYGGDVPYAQQMQIRQNISTSLDDMTARVQEAMRNITTPTRINPMFGFANNPERNELAALQSLIGNLQKELALPTEAEKEHGDKRSGLVAGLKTADLTSILTAGWSDAANQLRQSAALQKAAKGEPLSATDQMYVDLYELMQEAEANTQALGGTTSGANIGRGVAGSIPYMTGMVATSGVSGAARAYVSNAVKAIAPTGVKNFIDGAAKAAVGKAIGKKAITKGVSTVGGAAVGALAALPFQSGMYSNFAQKTLEQYDVDAGVARLARPTSTFKRLYQSSAEAFTDIFTEQMGGLLTKSARFLGRELGSKASLFNKLGRFNSGRISQLAFFGGPIEEFEEELWAGFLSPLLSAKSAEERTESWRQMFSAQSLWETAMTTALMSGGFSVLDAADNASATLRSRSLAKRSLSNIKDDGLRQTLYDGLHNKELETGVKDIASYDWSNASSGDMANAIDYVRFELNYQVRRGYATAQQSENEYLKRVVAAGESIYYGKDGNTPSNDIIIATTANGVYNVLAGDIDSTDPKATVIVRDAEGRRTQIANKEIQSVMSMPVSDYLSQAYAEIYGQVEQSVTPTQLQEDIADAQEAGVDPSAAISSQMDEAIEGSQFTLPDGRRGEVAALRPDGTVEINVLSSDGSVPIDNLEMGLHDVVPLIQAEDASEAEAQKIATEISSLPESEHENATEPTVETTEQEIMPNEPTVPATTEAPATTEPILPEVETPTTTEPQIESTVEPTVVEQVEPETEDIESEPTTEPNVQPESAEVDYSTMPAEKFAEAMLDINDSSEEAVQMVEDMRQSNNEKLQAALSEYETHKQNNKPTSANDLANYAAKRKELKATIEALQAEDKRLSDTLAALGGATTQEAVEPQQSVEPQTSKQEVSFIDPITMTDEDKQRRADMLHNAPAVDVKKEVITATPELSARKAAEKWWDDNVGEDVIYNTEVGEVEINNNSIESSLAHRYGQKKLDAITSLVEGFENAVYLGTMPDSRERGVVDHYFAYPIMYDGELNYVFCRAMQDANKNRLYVHEVFVADKIKKGDTLQTAASKPHGGISLYRDILANILLTDKDTTSEPISKETTEKSSNVPEQPTSEEPTTAPEPVVEPTTEVVEEPQTETEAEPKPEAVSASPYAEQPKSKEEQLAEEVKARILKEGTDFDKDFDLIAPKDVTLTKDISNNVDTIISKLAEKQANGESLDNYGSYVKGVGYDGNAYHQVKDYLVQLKKGIGELVPKWLQDNNMNDTDGLHAYVIERYEEAYNDAVKVKEEQKSDTVSQANSVEEMYDKMLVAHGPIAHAPLRRTFNLWAYTSDDKLRPGMTGIYHNADRQEVVATDAGILVASKTDYDKKFAGKVIGTNGKEIPNAVFPNYTALNTDDKVSIDISVENLKGILGGIKKEQKELWAKEKEEGKKPGAFKNFLSDTVVYIKLGNGKVSAFKLSLFEDFVVAMEHIGADKIYGSDPTRAIFAKSDKGLAMAMPRNNTLVDMEWRDENLPGRNYYIDVSANASKAPEALKKEETKKSKASKADKPKATKPNKVSDHVATRKAAATARKEAQQNLTYKYTPIGTGYFGDIYNQFKGRFNDAFDLLVENQGGEATAVFNRPEIGDIDLVWGDKKGGLAHIIDKHTGKDKSFSNNSEAKTVISDIINNGTVVFQDGDKVVIKSGHKQVTLRRNIREKGKKIADKNWLLTAYDETKADSTSAISATNQGRAAQPTNVTRGKSSKETDKNKTQLQDFGEKIEGARKDVYKTLAKAFDDATLQSLIELPFSKSFKRPDLAKLVESGVLREEDALYAEAFMTVYLSTAKPKPTKSDERLARIYGRPTKVTLWAEEAYKRIQQLQEFMLADNAKRDEIIASFAKPEAEQAAREEREYQERIGGRGPLRSPNPVGVIAEVLNRIGYSAGDTVKIDCPLVRVNSTFSRYELRLPDGSRNYQVPTAADLEEAITNLVMIAKMRRGDNDVQYHKEQFAVRGDTPIKKGNGKFVVGYIKKNGGVDHKRFSSEAEAKEFAAKQTGETVMREEQEVVGYEAYKVRFQKPLDGDFFVLSKSYPTREAALEAIENNLDELSAEANTFVAAKTDYEKNKKKAQDDLQVKILIDRDTRKPQYFVSTKRGEQVSGYFDSSAEARKYLAENKEAIQKRMEELKEARSKFAYFSSQGEPRVGEDYRKGVDATPEMFQDMFGFRGVQFGNWTNARDRQEALNQAYDGFMDLASVLGVSPRALSLAGELGLAFGARGGGSAAAHYELKDVVINLTKTKGAGSLAHEWWHALDNYFARQAGISQGMATKAKQLPGVRPEVKKAFDDIVKTVNNTFYAKRSKAKGDYWGSEIELTARLFGEWVVYELAKTGRSNHFLSRGITPETFEEFKRMNYAFYEWARRDKNITIMPYEEFANTPSALEDMPYPTKEETEQMGVKVRELFDTLQEREEGDNVVLYQREREEYSAAEAKMTTEQVLELVKAAGIDVEIATPDMVAALTESAQNPEYHIVYHGSGANFDKFDHSYMGSGEGAQAYGWGTYVTEVEGIGKQYAKKVRNRDTRLLYNGMPVNTNGHYNPWRIIKDLFEETRGKLRKMRSQADYYDSLAESDSPMKPVWVEVNRLLKEEIRSGDLKTDIAHNLYVVDIPNPDSGSYLQWDKPVSQYVIKRLINSLESNDGNFSFWVPENLREASRIDRAMYWMRESYPQNPKSGEAFYSLLSVVLGSNRAASKFLARNGYVGIEYPAQYSSGGRADKAKNYVIFDESNLKIVDHIEFMRTPEGVIYGWTVNGKIYLTEQGLNPETPIHEYTHIWDAACRKENPELWAEGVALMKQTPLWEQVRTNPDYASISNNEDLLASEVHARLVAPNGANVLAEMLEQQNTRPTLISRLKDWITQFWRWLRNETLPESKMSVDDFAKMPLKDLAQAKAQLQEREESDSTILFRDAEVEYTEEEEAIIDKAIADGTYLKASNGQPTNLTPKQWVQVRTKAFKKWFGDWEKAARIEKLRGQLPVEISGSEVPFNEDIALYRKNAEQYAKELRGTYTNRDTGNVIDLTRSGITELKQHDATSVAHLQSFAAIPQLIEQSIYITTLPNEDVKVKADSFDYYVSGLRIGGEDYTAKIVVANIGGKRYYDHKLSAIEKGSLLDLIRIPNLNQEQQTAIFEFKDKRLVSILQTNSSKIVDANGEPKVVEHSTWNEDFNTFDIERLGESSGDEGLYGAGFYFGNVGHTALYGDRSIQAYLNMERPLALPEDNIMRSFDYLVENFDKQGLRDIIVKGGGKSQSATMGEIIDIIKDVQARHSTGEYDELIEQMSQYWYPADDRVIEQTIFKKVGFAFYRALTPFIENNIGRREFTEALSKAGYDGVVYDNTEWVVYKPDQIKSATDNVGTFDSTNDDIRYREDRNGQQVEPRETIATRIIAEAQKLAATHNIPIEIHETREEITDSNSSMQRRKRASFGWFDPAEGKVHLVLPSHDSVEELQNTFYHEAVAHYGLPKLLGEEQFTALCGNVWTSLPAITQKRLIRKYPNADVNTMAEEYMATIAEGNITPGLFQRIIAFVREAFRKMGVNLRISDNDIAYLLWRSKNNLQRARTASQKATVIAADKRMRDVLFRDAEEPGAEIAKEVAEELRKEDVPAESMARIAKRRILDKYGKKYPHLQTLYETDNALEAAMVTEGFSTHTSKQLKAGAELLDMFERDLAIDEQREQGLLPKEVELKPKTIAEIDKRYGVNSTAKFYLYSDEHRNDARLRPENAVDTATMQLTISNEEFNKILDTNDADTLKLYRETLNNLLTAENGPFADEETVREEISKRFIAEGPTQGNVDETANQLGPYKQLRKAIKGRIRQIDDKLKVLSNAEVKPQIISKEELIERLHRPTETEKGSDELSLREKIYLGVFDAKAQVKQFQEALAAEGINITSAMDYYSAENRTSSIAEVEKNRFQRNFANPLKNQINELAAAFDESGADPYYIVSTYALAEHSIERHSSGISALSSDDGEGQWNLENTSNIVRLFREDIAEYTIERYAKHGKDAFSEEELRTLSPATRAKVEQGVEVDSLTDSEKMEIGEVKIEVLWRLINRLNDETLNIAQRAGLKSREEIALIKSHNWKYYVPLRDFDLDFENLTDPTEMLDNTFAQRKRSSTVFLPKAEGRTTKAADPFGQIIRTGQQFILVAETNKAKQRLLNLLVKATAQLPHATTAKYFEVGTRYMWKTYNEYLGKFVWREISDIDDFPPYEEMEKSKWAREKVRTLKSAMIQAAQNQDWQARNYYYQKMKEYEAEETIRFEYNNMDFNNEVRMSSVIDQTRIVEVWVNGRKQLMKFKDPAIAMAINGLSAVNESALFSAVDKVVGTPTRWLAKVRTQLSPDFIVTNAIRDFRHALRMHYLDAENGHLKGFVNNYNTKTAQAINRGIRGKASPLTINELRGYRLSNPAHIRELTTLYGEDRVMDTLFDLFQSYGGQTGFAFAEDTKTIERDIRREYAREKAMRSERPVVRAWGKSREAASVVSEAFKMGSEVVENMSRFATFLANIEAGRTAEEAAQAAKEITVNFNRRGQYTKTLGGLYTFFNATMQAMAQVYRVGKENPKRLAALAIYEVAKGFAIAMLAELFKGDDDKEVPAYTLKENLVIPLLGGKYLKFPEPQTFSVFHGIGVDLAQAALGKISNAEVANNLIHSVLEASVYGYTEGGTDMALLVLMPSIFEPFVDVARNKNAFGSQIHPEDNWGLTPDSELGNRNTNELIYLICKSLNQLGGGNEVRPAGMTDDGDIIQFINLLDVNPANVEYIINQFAGGSIYGGKFAQQLWRLAASLVSDREATLKDVPMLNRILGTLDTATPNSAYYREKERIENAYSVMNKENKAGMDVDPIQLEYHTRRRNYIKYIQKQIDAVREVQYSHKVNSEAYNAYKEIVEDYMRLCVKALNNADWTSGAERKREQYINSLYKEYGIESKLQTLNEKYGN